MMLANGALSSNIGGEGQIRQSLSLLRCEEGIRSLFWEREWGIKKQGVRSLLDIENIKACGYKEALVIVCSHAYLLLYAR